MRKQSSLEMSGPGKEDIGDKEVGVNPRMVMISAGWW